MLTLSDAISPGERTEIRLINENESEQEKNQNVKIYITRVNDILNENELELTMPLEQGRLVLLPQGQKLDCIFYAKSGIYQCGGVVAERYKTDNIYLIKVKATSKLITKQSREYYRCDCLLRMEAAKLDLRDKKEITWQELEGLSEVKDGMEDCVMLDISGGGARFVSVSRFEKGDLLHLRFVLTMGGRKKTYNLAGVIIRSDEHERRKEEYVNSLQFVSVADKDQQDIVRFVFQEEVRKKNTFYR